MIYYQNRMKKNNLAYLLIAVLIVCSHSASFNQNTLYDLVLQSQERGASCLDGSPPGLYINEGSGENKNKFMIYFEGGGFCGADTLPDTLQSCFKRSSSDLGSTNSFPKTKSFKNHGLLSTDEAENPVFYDWTKIYVIYCDGSVHQGHRENPISYKGKNLYFRGTKNTMEHFSYLQSKYNWYNSEAIVITGVSAGGMGTYQWVSYLSSQTVTAKVMAIPDSGFFITDYYSQLVQSKVLRGQIGNLIKLVNVEQDFEKYLPEPIQQCLDKPVWMDLVDCYNSANYVEFLTDIPILAIQSPVDAYSLSHIVIADKCFTNRQPPYSLSQCDDVIMASIDDYRKESLRYLAQMKAHGKNAWGPVCVQHGFSTYPSFTDSNFQVNGQKLVDVVRKFVNQNLQSSNLNIKREEVGEQLWLVDEAPWPANQGCNGIKQGGQAKQQLQIIYDIINSLIDNKNFETKENTGAESEDQIEDIVSE